MAIFPLGYYKCTAQINILTKEVKLIEYPQM